MTDPINLLKKCFNDLVGHASAASALDGAMPCPPAAAGRTYLLAIGKAAAAMAQEFERQWPADAPLSGIALTRYSHGASCQRVEVIEASHPVPDTVGLETAQRVVDQVSQLGADDSLVCLISGGGSALLSLPVPAVSAPEKRSVNRQLLASGLPIDQMNCLRKHLSAVKGGRLAELAHPARVHTIAISDVPGNDLSTIASGPTVPDLTTRQQALDIARALPDTPASVLDWLNQPQAETPSGSAAFDADTALVTVTPETAFAALASDLSSQHPDMEVHFLGADLEGEAKELGKQHAALAKDLKASTNGRPQLILSGGETTVTLPAGSSAGKGGRNAEYLLAFTCALAGEQGIYALAADTDGIDGSEDNAGAWIAPGNWQRAQDLGLDPDLDPMAYLSGHDSYSWFQEMGLLLKTGPTLTNVNDFRAILVLPD